MRPTCGTLRTVTRATPSNSTSETTWTWQVREKWYYHDTESGQEMMTGPPSTDAPVLLHPSFGSSTSTGALPVPVRSSTPPRIPRSRRLIWDALAMCRGDH